MQRGNAEVRERRTRIRRIWRIGADRAGADLRRDRTQRSRGEPEGNGAPRGRGCSRKTVALDPCEFIRPIHPIPSPQRPPISPYLWMQAPPLKGPAPPPLRTSAAVPLRTSAVKAVAVECPSNPESRVTIKLNPEIAPGPPGLATDMCRSARKRDSDGARRRRRPSHAGSGGPGRTPA